MADPTLTASVPSQAGPSRTSSRHDIEGLGKFKLTNAAPRGNSYKGKFFVLKETYDVVTARREDLRKELELANMRLKSVQAENDLLLDAMQIVTPSQPSLVNILKQMEPEALSAPASLGGGSGAGAEMFVDPRPVKPIPTPPSAYVPPNPREQRLGPSMDAAALNGNGNGSGYTHHAPVHAVNGRARAREYREREEPPADEEMLDDDALLAEREHERVPPPGTGTNGR